MEANDGHPIFLEHMAACAHYCLPGSSSGARVPFVFAVSLEVQITPSQGEISVGESKFFLCDGKAISI
jgi:hypothetical protein